VSSKKRSSQEPRAGERSARRLRPRQLAGDAHRHQTKRRSSEQDHRPGCVALDGEMTSHATRPARLPLTAADVMTAAEVAALVRVPRSTVEDWARRGIIPSKKVGRRRLYIRSRIEAPLLDDAEIGVQDGEVVPTGGTHQRLPPS
jgi:excisionase family DNA binding protein